jgi:phosphatidylglycerol:prolipoprotein diacylglycerol transferase
MHPVLFRFFFLGKDIVIGTYGVIMVAAIVAGLLISLAIARKYGYHSSSFINYCLLVIAGIIGGSLLAGYVMFLPERLGREFIDYPPALVSWGGIAGGLAVLIIIKFKFREPFLLIADIITPGYLIGLGIGRIGCLFAGCCYGIYTSSCIGIAFTDPMAPASLMKQPLVPTQLISALFLIGAGLTFIPIILRRKNTGFGFGFSAILYSIFRFFIEFWRDDPRVFIFGLSDGQIFSVIYCMIGVAIVIYISRKTSPPGPLSHGRGGATLMLI